MSSNALFVKSLHWIVFLSLITVSYIGLGKFSISFSTMPEGIAIAWFPNGLLLTLFLLRPVREWALFAAVIVPAEIVADIPHFTLFQAVQFAIINLSETMFSAFLIRRFSPDNHNFHNLRYFLLFVIVALTLSPALSAILGAFVYETQIESQSNFIAFWRIWLFGDALGILMITPLLVSWYEMKEQLSWRFISWEPVIMTPLTLILAYVLFSNELTPNLLPTTPIIFILALLWMSYRRGLMESVTMSVLLSLIAIYFTVHHQGPFSVFNSVQNTLYLQEFIAVLIMTTLFFSVLLRQVNDKTILLEELSKNLEDQVMDKTIALQTANQKLFELATTDPLTRIYNRRFLEERAEQEVSRAIRHKSDLSLIMFDIDFFKTINDTYGHHAGDDVLMALTQTVLSRIRQDDIFARIGGEEFVILMPHTMLSEAVVLATALKEMIAHLAIPAEHSTISFTISIGVSTLFDECNCYENLLYHADTLLYQAKEAGRNRIGWMDDFKVVHIKS